MKERNSATETNQATQPHSYLRLADMRARYRVSGATIWKWAADPKSGFPKPVKLGANTTAWRLTDLHAWEESRETISRESPIAGSARKNDSKINRTKLKYWIVESFEDDPHGALNWLEDEVERFISLGWVPVGGVCVISCADGYLACQALTNDGDGQIPSVK